MNHQNLPSKFCKISHSLEEVSSHQIKVPFKLHGWFFVVYVGSINNKVELYVLVSLE